MRQAGQRVQLADLVDCLQHPLTLGPSLTESLKDIAILTAFSRTQFPEYVTEMRKKTIQLLKGYKLSCRTAKQMEDMYKNKQPPPVANPKFAFQIHRLAQDSIEEKLPKRRMLTELKLKFMESDGVTEGHWERWFSRDEKLLVLGEDSSTVNVKVGLRLCQEKGEAAFRWAVKEATDCKREHFSLTVLFTEYLNWVSKNKDDWECSFLMNCIHLIRNMPACQTFLCLNQAHLFTHNPFPENIPVILEHTPTTACHWAQNLFENPQSPILSLHIDSEKMLQCQFSGQKVTGRFYLRAEKQEGNQNQEEIILVSVNKIYLQNPRMFAFVAEAASKYRLIYRQSKLKYLQLNSPLVKFFIVLMDQIWTPQGIELNRKQIKPFSEGLWARVGSEEAPLFWHFSQDSAISCHGAQRSLISHLLQEESLTLPFLLDHLRLRQAILYHNHELQYRARQLFCQTIENKLVFVMLFRSFQQIDQKTYFRPDWLDPCQNFNLPFNDFVLVVRVWFDFKKVTFRAYKEKEGPDSHSQIGENFLPPWWSSYYQRHTSKDEKIQWQELFKCISYLGRCYLIERQHSRRLGKQLKQLARYQLK